LYGQPPDETLETLTLRVRELRAGTLPTQEFRRAAEARAAVLRDMIRTDPARALRSSLPEDEAARLREWAPRLVEVTGAWQGPLEVRVEDFADGTSRRRYMLQAPAAELEVFPATTPPKESCGQAVTVSGVQMGGEIAASAIEVQAALASCTTTGAQKAAVILVNFASTPLPANITPAFVQNAFFGTSRSVDTYWREASYNLMSVTGQVFGPFTIADTPCTSTSAIRSAAIAAADASVDFRNFNRIFIIHPLAGSCAIGVGTVGCSTLTSADGNFVAATAWMRADYLATTDRVISVGTHEGGHGLGLLHSSTMDYGAVALGPPGGAGVFTEYMDVFSAMGLSFNIGSTVLIGHYPGIQKAALGWLASGTDYQNVTFDGTFTLAPYEGAAPGTKALRVQRPGTNKWIWIEYRQPIGSFDPTLNLYSPNIFGGALIHYEDPNDANAGQTLLLDFTPTSTPNNFADAALVAGRTWSDPDTTLRISIGTPAAAGLPVTISGAASGPPCDMNGDGSVNVIDVQLSVNKALGITACGAGDLDGDGSCTVIDVQRVVLAALGGSCRLGP
jgi:M6 family metalloprotease-like protein